MVLLDKLVVTKESLKIRKRNMIGTSIQGGGEIFEFRIKTFEDIEV